ncbi:MAG: DNA alkylation repair protein, partial [Chloroflexi bacterium]|nr:DNA alkylation repair protein [Chloroflexota bacterium]
MTAINPARLKIQSSALAEKFSDPGGFVTGLHDLLGFYASRIRQTSLSRTNLTLQVYQVPVPVLRAMENELDQNLNSYPSQGLELVDALWKEEWVEFRQLAINLLGKLPPDHPEQIFDHILNWLGSRTAEDVSRSIMDQGLERLRSEKPTLVLNFFEKMVSKGGKGEQQAVLFGLMPFVDNPAFDNLPIVYDLVANILLAEENKLIKELTT